MPYTKNTRIKVVNKKFHKEYTAQVEYRYPFTNIKVWEDFQNTSCNVLKGCLQTVVGVPYHLTHTMIVCGMIM